MVVFGRVHWQNEDVKEGLRKFHFVSIRLCHQFDWQALSIDVSAILSVGRDQSLPNVFSNYSRHNNYANVNVQKTV